MARSRLSPIRFGISSAAPNDAGWRKALFRRFGVWLLLGLEFALAADIVRSAISPWDDIGQLAAIAAIRTFLNHFLERDLGEAGAEWEPFLLLTCFIALYESKRWGG
jgi:hypothetical protein